MTARKKRRMIAIFGGLALLAIAVGLILNAVTDSLVFFITPSEVQTKQIDPNQRLRLGGLVKDGSVTKGQDGLTTLFIVTDLEAEIPVSYRGILPDLFREGQGVVAEGKLDGDGHFTAETVLAKHDENYMPKEVADALKKSGNWQHATPGAPE